MIWEIFTLLLASSFLLLFYGFYVKSDSFRLIGAVLLFLFGGMLSPSVPSLIGQLEYKTGIIQNVTGNITTITDTLGVYTNHTLGFYFALLGIVALIVIMVDRRTD
jgi:hypothetical protein